MAVKKKPAVAVFVVAAGRADGLEGRVRDVIADELRPLLRPVLTFNKAVRELADDASFSDADLGRNVRALVAATAQAGEFA